MLEGSSTLTLPAGTLQHLTRLLEQLLGPREQARGFVALPSHPAETAAVLQAQFLFDVLQKTRSLKVRPGRRRVPSPNASVRGVWAQQLSPLAPRW